MSEKLVNFRTEEEKYNELKMLALKEKTTVKALLSGLVDDYIKKHGDGNPQFTIDQFEDPDFIACPAFYRDASTWDYYCKNSEPTELNKVKSQILLIEKQMMKYL